MRCLRNSGPSTNILLGEIVGQVFVGSAVGLGLKRLLNACGELYPFAIPGGKNGS